MTSRKRTTPRRRPIQLALLLPAIAAIVALVFAFAPIAGARSCQLPQGFPWGQAITPDGDRCWERNEGAGFARWLRAHGAPAKTFRERHPELARVFKQPWPPPRFEWNLLERDFHKALGHATGRFGVSYSWLHNCAHSEGGHGPAFVWGSAGELGPFQYLPGTFEYMSRSAFQTRGAPPSSYRRRDSVVGQTWTAAWAFSQGLSYHWYGAGC